MKVEQVHDGCTDRWSVLVNTRGYLISHIIGHSYVFLTIPILKKHLSPDEFGYYTIIVSLISMIQIGAITLFSHALYKFYVEYKGFERQVFLGNIFGGMFVIQLLVTSTIFFMRHSLIKWMYPNLTLPLDPYVLLSMFWLVLTSGKALCMTTLKIRELPGMMIRYNIFYGVSIILLISILVLALNLGLTGALLAFISAELVTQIFIGRGIWTEARLGWRPEQLKRTVVFSTPLVVGTICFISAQNLDRVVLSRFISLDLLGDYGVGVMLGSVAALISTSFTPSYTARVLKILHNEGKEKAKSVLEDAYNDGSLIIGCFIMLLIISTDILGLLLVGNQSVVLVARVATCIALGHFVRFIFLFSQNVFYVSGRSLAIMKINLLLVITVLVLNLTFAYTIGPLWMSCSIGAAYGVLFFPVSLFSNKHIPLRIPFTQILKVSSSAILLILLQECIYLRGLEINSLQYWGLKVLELMVVGFFMGGTFYNRFRITGALS